MESINDLLLQLSVFFVISILIARYVNGTIITPSNAFWFGWLCLLSGTKSFVSSNLMRDFGSLEIYYLNEFHRAAFIGFTLASFSSNIIFFRQKKDISSLKLLYHYSSYLTNKVSNKFLNVLFFLGVIFLIQRIRLVGLNINFFSNARALYIEDGFNIFAWLGSHLSVIVYTFIIIQGIRDAFLEMDLKRLFKVILFASPLFLANATRTFLIFPLINYFASFLLMRSFINVRKIVSIKEFAKGTYILFFFLFVFAIIGFVRGGYGDEFNFINTVLSWPVSTSYALDSWLNVSINSDSTNGLLTFDWFANFLDRIGVLNYEYEKQNLKNVISGFVLTQNSAAVIPRSIIPDLIFDFGEDNLFFSTIILTFLVQLTGVVLAGKSLIKHTIATLLVIGMFMTIQTSLFAPGFVVSVFWIVIIHIFTLKFIPKSNYDGK